MRPGTWLLWFGPAAVILLGAGGIALFFRRRGGTAESPAPLSEAERGRLARVLGDEDRS